MLIRTRAATGYAAARVAGWASVVRVVRPATAASAAVAGSSSRHVGAEDQTRRLVDRRSGPDDKHVRHRAAGRPELARGKDSDTVVRVIGDRQIADVVEA